MTAAGRTALARYQWAADFINGLIQGPPSPPPGATAEEIRARAVARMERLRRFLAFLGDPQTRFRSVHVGGTSGKGSTAAFIAAILHAAGYRTGLHVSPYLQVETEKLQVDGRLVCGDAFADHVAALAEAMERWQAERSERLTYGEFWVALTFFAFARERVDFAVIEVGAGGRFDLTNVLLPDVAVITSVGLDHVRTLGPTIADIAWHKAGIIKPGRAAVTAVDDPVALPVIEAEARAQGVPLQRVLPERDYRVVDSDASGSELLDVPSGRVFHLPLAGAFQAANAATAIAAARALRDLPRGPISDDAIAAGLAATRFPGRMEIVQERPQVVLDGAHNPQKMASLAASLPLLGRPERRIVVLGVLEGHDAEALARIVAPLADEVVATAPHAIERASAP
ncbi:MAG: bifunctional folylpolyglutamate synthase/dihydrofolate synthase, partial [Thermomicrobiaceae bacterium]|nr:bifunctional folylpolyglutamate synthase/dihydrofolate synthase [Thermomicrobiaceae bacterium]